MAPDSVTGYRSRLTASANLGEDERLLRGGGPAFRVAVIADRCVSLGVSQRADTRAALEAQRLGLPVVRRSSGGTGLLHLPGDIAWSLAVPREHPSVGREFARAYARLGTPLVDALAALRVTADWRSSPGTSAEFCLLGPRGETLFAGPAAIGGAAQHLTAASLLHHGIVSVEVDRPMLQDLFGLDTLTASGVSGLRSLGVSSSSEEIARGLLSSLERWGATVGLSRAP
jgi:lipoate-protein ligase A